MSFLDDDFYSAKTSTWKSTNRGFRPWQKGKWIILVLIPFILGAVLVVFPLLTGNNYMAADHASGRISVKELAELKKDYNELVIRAAERVNPAVVSVIGIQKNEGNKMEPSSIGLGSGVIFQKIGKKARIITNNHVIQSVNEIQVVLTNGEKRQADLIGTDMFTDLAVLEIESTGIERVAEFGDSELLKPGETAIAIGNPLGLGYSQTITVGVISSPLRTLAVSLGEDGNLDWELDVIQTDAAINMGNSGGALVNLEGKVIGINSMKVADMGVEGLGFAIPINDAKPIIESLIMDGKVKRPYLGVYTQDLQGFLDKDKVLKLPKEVKTGIIVLESVGPSEEAGLKTHDVIVELDGKNIDSTLALRKYLYSSKEIGDVIEVTYYRGGKKQKVTAKLGELEAE